MNSLSTHSFSWLMNPVVVTQIYTTAYFFSSGHLSSSLLMVPVAPLFVILWEIPHCQTCSSDHNWISFGFRPSELRTRFAAPTGRRLVQSNITQTIITRHWSIHFRDGRRIQVSLNDILSCMLGEITKTYSFWFFQGANKFVFFRRFSLFLKLRRSWSWSCTLYSPVQPLTYWTRCIKEQVSTFVILTTFWMRFILSHYRIFHLPHVLYLLIIKWTHYSVFLLLFSDVLLLWDVYM